MWFTFGWVAVAWGVVRGIYIYARETNLVSGKLAVPGNSPRKLSLNWYLVAWMSQVKPSQRKQQSGVASCRRVTRWVAESWESVMGDRAWEVGRTGSCGPCWPYSGSCSSFLLNDYRQSSFRNLLSNPLFCSLQIIWSVHEDLVWFSRFLSLPFPACLDKSQLC